MEWLPDGRLLVCDAYRGLLAVDVVAGVTAGDDPAALKAAVSVLTDTADGVPLKLCNNAAVGRDGTIWFTDSSGRFDLANYRADIFEHSGTGRLLRRDPDGTTHTLRRPGCSSPTASRWPPTSRACSSRRPAATGSTGCWLTGDRAGEVEVVLDNLPGFPDNLSLGDDGLVWMAMASPRDRGRRRPGAARRRSSARRCGRCPNALQPRPRSSPSG